METSWYWWLLQGFFFDQFSLSHCLCVCVCVHSGNLLYYSPFSSCSRCGRGEHQAALPHPLSPPKRVVEDASSSSSSSLCAFPSLWLQSWKTPVLQGCHVAEQKSEHCRNCSFDNDRFFLPLLYLLKFKYCSIRENSNMVCSRVITM